MVVAEAMIVPLFVIPPTKLDTMIASMPSALAWPVRLIRPPLVMPPAKVTALSK